MVSEPLVSRSTKAAIDSYVKQPTMPLLIVGASGSGKLAVAKTVSSRLLAVQLSEINLNADYQVVSAGKSESEGVEAIRQAIRRLSLKNTARAGQSRVLLINKANELSLEAQNTLLKTLEEPSKGSIVILTSRSDTSIIPTIVSRCVVVSVNPVSLEDSLKYYQHEFLENDIKSAWNLSEGYSGLLDTLLKSGNEHPLKTAVANAKLLLTLPTYERLIFIEQKAPSREELKLLLTATSRVLSSAHKSSLSSDRADKEKILSNRKLINNINIKIKNNANVKLSSLQLALRLKV